MLAESGRLIQSRLLWELGNIAVTQGYSMTFPCFY